MKRFMAEMLLKKKAEREKKEKEDGPKKSGSLFNRIQSNKD